MSGYPQQHTAYAPPHHQGAYNHQPVPGMQPQTPLMPANEHDHSHSDHSHSEKGISHNGEWGHGFCSCCTPFGTCCLGTWCPCILYGRNHYRLDKGSLDGYSCCNMRCVFYGCLTICSPLQTFLGYFQRKKIRERYGLKGGCCGDCLRHCCCPCCALIQEDKEVVDKTKQAGYQASSGMHYPTK